MPYNLRKRKAPEAAIHEEPVAKKTPAKKPPAPKKKAAPQVSKSPTPPPPPPTVATKPSASTKPPASKKSAPAAKIAASTKPVAPIKPASPTPPEAPKPPPAPLVCNQLMFGQDSCGELGFKKIGFTKKTPTPVQIDEVIKQVCCGPMHTLSLTESGKVYAYGCNDEGALGRVTDGDEELEATPTVVPLDGKVIKVSAGDSHSAALTDDKRVFIWGNFRDEHGSVGLTVNCNGEASHKPIQVLPKTPLIDIASGSNHMLLLDTEGIVYSFGVGTQGQLGRLKPEEIVDDEGDKITDQKKRELFLNPKPVSLKNVDPQRPFVCDAIFAGNFSSFATNTDKKKNRLAGWGLNNYFQLGYKGLKGQLVQYFPKRSTFTCSVTMTNVACGPHHTLFLTKTGRVYAAGRQTYGMLGLGDVNKEVCPAKQVAFPDDSDGKMSDICAGINTSFAVSENGKLYSWGMSGLNLGIKGEDDLNEPTKVESLEPHKVKSIATGGSFSAVLVER